MRTSTSPTKTSAAETGGERTGRLPRAVIRQRPGPLPVEARRAVVVRAVGAIKTDGKGGGAVLALDRVDVEFAVGALSAIMGPSGSGKSTLMRCLAGLDELTSGRVLIGDVHFTTLNDKHLSLLPRDKPGFIFQAYDSVPTLTALGDITLASKGPASWWPRPLERARQRERGARSASWWMVQSSPHPAGPTSRRIP